MYIHIYRTKELQIQKQTNLGLLDGAVLFDDFLELVIGDGTRNVAHVQSPFRHGGSVRGNALGNCIESPGV